MKWYNDLSEQRKTILWLSGVVLLVLGLLYWTLSPYFWGKYNGYNDGKSSCPQINVSVFLSEDMRRQLVDVGKIGARERFEAHVEATRKQGGKIAYKGYQLETLGNGYVEGWGEGFGECFGL